MNPGSLIESWSRSSILRRRRFAALAIENPAKGLAVCAYAAGQKEFLRLYCSILLSGVNFGLHGVLLGISLVKPQEPALGRDCGESLLS